MMRDLRSLGEIPAPSRVAVDVLSRVGLEDEYIQLQSPVGQVFVAFNRRGLSAVSGAESEAEFERSFRARLGRSVHRASAPPSALVDKLREELSGKRRSRLGFDLRGLSEFERAVLLKALEIPRGEVRPYGWIAREINRPKAVRAVGTALAHNPIPLFIPCHRVVRSDGHIGQYGLGGRSAKLAVLASEGLDAQALEALARSGQRYHGSDSTRIFCFPTCRHARRVSDEHRVTFRSESEAMSAGYRPCKICRPAGRLAPNAK